MRGKTVLITGGSSGIGLETARGLARLGARVVIVGRNADRTAAAVDELRRDTGSDDVHSLLGDLSLMRETRRVAAEFDARYDRLDVLINNAGGIFQRRTFTDEGLEYTFALNHMSYYLLTRLLLDKIAVSAPARVIVVSSGAHFLTGGVKFADLQRRRGIYIGFSRYNESKLMNMLFALALARRIDPATATVNAVHPGLVASGFGKNNRGLLAFGVAMASRLFGLTPEQGAATTIYAAASDIGGEVTGGYFERSAIAAPSTLAVDIEAQERLWAASAALAGLPV